MALRAERESMSHLPTPGSSKIFFLFFIQAQNVNLMTWGKIEASSGGKNREIRRGRKKLAWGKMKRQKQGHRECVLGTLCH